MPAVEAAPAAVVASAVGRPVGPAGEGGARPTPAAGQLGDQTATGVPGAPALATSHSGMVGQDGPSADRDGGATPEGNPGATPEGNPRATPEGNPGATSEGDPGANPGTVSRAAAAAGASSNPTATTPATRSPAATAPQSAPATQSAPANTAAATNLTPAIAPTSPATGTATAPGTAGATAQSPVTLDRAIEAVQRAIEQSANQGVSQARIQLSPESLGDIRIHLQSTSDGIVARVVAGHEAAQSFQQNADDLRRSLQSHGLNLLRLEVQSSGSGGASSDLGAGHSQNQERGVGGQGAQASTTGESTDAPDPVSPTSQLSAGALIDVLA